MTRLRRFSNCNLHWYCPRRFQHELWAGKAPHCCGWDWLGSLVPLRLLNQPLYGLCDHVHTPHGRR